MIDHLVIPARDLKVSGEFYQKTLAALGYRAVFEEKHPETGASQVLGYGTSEEPEFLIFKTDAHIEQIHVAFGVPNRPLVDAFYKAAIAAGGRDNGKPELCPEYHANYYAGFVLDPDGHNIEAVCHGQGR